MRLVFPCVWKCQPLPMDDWRVLKHDAGWSHLHFDVSWGLSEGGERTGNVTLNGCHVTSTVKHFISWVGKEIHYLIDNKKYLNILGVKVVNKIHINFNVNNDLQYLNTPLNMGTFLTFCRRKQSPLSLFLCRSQPPGAEYFSYWYTVYLWLMPPQSVFGISVWEWATCHSSRWP